MPRWETVDLLLDTGATDTALRDYIIDRLGLSLLGLHGVHGFNGPRDTMQFSADLEIHLDRGAKKEFRDWKLLRFDPKGYDKIQGVVGRDILAHAKFCIDGPRQEFTLEF
jgi:hypothetical protein